MKGDINMDKSFWSDLVSLAKAGYKPSDVKELLALGAVDPEEKKEPEKKEPEKKEEPAPKQEENKTKSAFETLAEKE